MKRSRTQLTRIILSLCLLGFVTGVIISPRPVHAQWTVATVADVPRTIFQAIDKVMQKLAKVFKITGDVAFKSSLELFQAKLLERVQTELATVGPGQKPLFLTNPKTFFKSVANSAAGDYIDNFTRGVTGELGPGTSTSGARGKYLISRFLKVQAGAAVGGLTEQCKEDCANSYSADKVDVEALNKMSVKEFSEATGNYQGMRNAHELRVAVLSYDIGKSGGVKSKAKDDKAASISCPDILAAGSGSAIPWVYALAQSTTLPAGDCLNALSLLINSERSIAQAETNQCLQNCQSSSAAATNAISGFTATDIFSAVKNATPSQAPLAVANALSNNKSDIGALLSAAGAMTATVQDTVQGEQTNLGANILPVTTKVSDVVKSPSTTASTLLGIPFVGSDGKFTYTGTSIADILKGVLSFLNSPVGKALKNYFSSKCGLNPDACKGPSNSKSTIGQLVYGSGPAAASKIGVAAAKIIYAPLGKVDVPSGNPGLNEVFVTEQLASSGLVDAGFRQAIEETLTVQEAVDKGFLDKQTTFGFDKNGVEPKSGYPFRALQYLRKNRITPVGWELAAKYSQLFDHRDLSIGYLLSRYNICNQDAHKQVCTSISTNKCLTQTDIEACTAASGTCTNLLCSTGDTDCSTPALKTACEGTGGTCGNQFVSGEHSVCVSGSKADQSCQSDRDCGLDQNGAVITCGASPYCGLVDPNWVLKAPQTFCRRQGAGEEILTREFVCDANNIDQEDGRLIATGEICIPQDFTEKCVNPSNATEPMACAGGGVWVGPRCHDEGAPNCVAGSGNKNPDIGRWIIERNSETCADTQSCISENDNGTCLAYGYCIQERQQFKFDGTQCAVQNSTCASFKNSLGQEASYLQNTLDSRNCTADNAGCTEYCDSSNYNPTDKQCTGSNTINFTAKVQKCDAAQVGCTKYLQTSGNANILANGGFEYFTPATYLNSASSADYPSWTKTAGIGTYAVSADDPALPISNRAAVSLRGVATDSISQIINTGYDLYERTFTFSIRAKANAACSAALLLGPNTNQPNHPQIPADPDPNVTNINVGTQWASYAVTLSIPSLDTYAYIPNASGPIYSLKAGIRLGTCAVGDFVVDSAQLEPATGPTQFHDYGSTDVLYMNNNKISCEPADVGCMGYTPVAGGSEIFGQVLDSNRCSADKVGCGSFQLEPIVNVPERDGDQVNIVAPKGEKCSAADVGCEEYTNLDEVAKGGEGKEYFKSVKQCLKPSQVRPGNAAAPAESATYYTWIGDAQLGYVLRSYDLVKSDIDQAPCTNLTIEEAGVLPHCDEASSVDTSLTCNASKLATNSDCAQYYDSALNIYYRLRSKTVTITEDCHPYRNTIDQSIVARKNLVYHLATKENLTCSAAMAGCRAYTGNASGTTRQVLSDNFETNGTAKWEGGQATNASVNIGGNSMLVRTVGVGSSTAVVTRDTTLKNQLFAGRTYLVSFIASTASTTLIPPTHPNPTVAVSLGTSGATFSPDPALGFSGPVAINGWNEAITPSGPEWHSYTVGPLVLPANFNQADLRLGFVVTNGDVNIDNIVLTEVNDHIYLLSGSVPMCTDAEVGCAAYRDRKQVTNYLSSFTRLCSEPVVGCEALIDTKNSATPIAQTVKEVETPADSVVTLVNNAAAYCPAKSKGCNVFGLATKTADDVLVNYTSMYLINDPDRHSGDLCLKNELSCQVYTTAAGSATYFKDPQQRVCDYRESVDGAGQWFITGTSLPCPTVTPPLVGRPTGASCTTACRGVCNNDLSLTCVQNSDCGANTVCIYGGDRLGKACVSDADCPNSNTAGGGGCKGDANQNGNVNSGKGYGTPGQCSSNNDCAYSGNTCLYMAGSCPTEENGCTEYRDPTDPVNCRAECPLSLAQGGSADLVDSTCKRTYCKDGNRAGQNCASDINCLDATGVHTCVGGSGQQAIGLPGCRSYFYLRQSIETNAGSCNGVVDTTIGCRPFNDTSQSGLNFRAQ